LRVRSWRTRLPACVAPTQPPRPARETPRPSGRSSEVKPSGSGLTDGFLYRETWSLYMEIALLFWIGLSFAVSALAHSRGRDGFGWFFGSLLLSPLLALIIVACMPKNTIGLEKRALKGGKMTRCPACREIVSKKASVCKYCRHNFAACKCPNCSAGFVYEQSRSGTNVKCGKCNSTFLYPSL